MKKGVYPYEYMSGLDKLSETKLPPKSVFWSKLSDGNVTEEGYQYAQKVWSETNCKSLRDYTEVYLKTDVLILTDVFEMFRSMCLEHYKLDPVWYYTANGLFRDAALKLSDVGLELITGENANIYKFIESCVRGGVSMISHRYAEGNNKYMENYDPDKPSSYIKYTDANALYSNPMMDSLPVSGFRWVEEEDLEKWDEICSVDGNGMFLNVDLDYPRRLLSPQRLSTRTREAKR